MMDVQIIINCTLNIDFLSDHMESVDLILRGPQLIENFQRVRWQGQIIKNRF